MCGGGGAFIWVVRVGVRSNGIKCHQEQAIQPLKVLASIYVTVIERVHLILKRGHGRFSMHKDFLI
jgi:hypothetical protein